MVLELIILGYLIAYEHYSRYIYYSNLQYTRKNATVFIIHNSSTNHESRTHYLITTGFQLICCRVQHLTVA